MTAEIERLINRCQLLDCPGFAKRLQKKCLELVEASPRQTRKLQRELRLAITQITETLDDIECKVNNHDHPLT